MINLLDLAKYLEGYDPRISHVDITKEFHWNGIKIHIHFHNTLKSWIIVVNALELHYSEHNFVKNVLRELDKVLTKIPPIPPPYKIQVDPKVVELLKQTADTNMPPDIVKGMMSKILTAKELDYLTDTYTKWQEFAKNKNKQVVDGKCICPACTAGLAPAIPSMGLLGDRVKHEIAKACPGTKELVNNCPVCKTTGPMPLLEMVIHINDGHSEWDRGRIADWLESLDIDIQFKEVSNG